MPHPKSKTTDAKACAALEAALKKDWGDAATRCGQQPDVVPARFKTRAQLEVLLGLSHSGMSSRIHTALKSGVCETRSFVVKQRDGRIRVMPHYAIKMKNPSKG